MQSNNGSSASRRPPLPRKFKNTVGILDHDNENNQQCLDVSSPYYHNNLFATSTGLDSGLSIVNTGATKAVANVGRQENKDRHLWSEAILPDGRMSVINRSMSLSEQRKPSYNTVMSDSLLRTLDTLSLTSHDTFVQGR